MNEQNKDIETKWVRNCPSCNKILIYKTRRNWYKCSKENTSCIECGPKKRKDKNILIENAIKVVKDNIVYYIRKCPKCNKEIEHKNKYSYTKGLIQNKDCNYCSRQKLGLSNKNKVRSKEVKSKISKKMKGIIFTDERNTKLRNTWVNKYQNEYLVKGKEFKPNFNPKACQIIEEYGKEHGYNFQHALNGGEYLIKDLGYWVDGYDIEKNIVIEYMEKHHKQTIEKDNKREEQIIKFLNCKFIKIYE